MHFDGRIGEKLSQSDITHDFFHSVQNTILVALNLSHVYLYQMSPPLAWAYVVEVGVRKEVTISTSTILQTIIRTQTLGHNQRRRKSKIVLRLRSNLTPHLGRRNNLGNKQCDLTGFLDEPIVQHFSYKIWPVTSEKLAVLAPQRCVFSHVLPHPVFSAKCYWSQE